MLASALILAALASSASATIPLGLIVSDWGESGSAVPAINSAMEQYRVNSSQEESLQFFGDIIKTVDAYKLSKIICRKLERGIFALLGSVDPESFDTLHSYANAFQTPFVTPWFPESLYAEPPRDENLPKMPVTNFAVQIRPDYHGAIVDIIDHYGWDKVIYIYTDFDGLLRLQDIYKSIPQDHRGVFKFQVESVRRVSSAAEALQYLHQLEAINRHSLKRVVLDCPEAMTKEILKSHVASVHLGRRNFHYLLSSLVLEADWEDRAPEYGAINVTGLRLFNQEYGDGARAFLRRWRKEHRGSDGLPAVGVLAYDAVEVLAEAFKILKSVRPNVLRPSSPYSGSRWSAPNLRCNMSAEERSKAWEHGEDILKAIKSVHLPRALSGNLRFSDDGRRVDFSLDVVEMTPNGGNLIKVGRWSDSEGLTMDDGEFPHRGHLPIIRGGIRGYRNRTVVMTTILDEPYMMLSRPDKDGKPKVGNERFEGYCKDLADLIARETNLTFIIKPVKDGKYGSKDKKSGEWNGMIGELVKREAEVAIAPLTINSQREMVADFTKPFMSLGISIMIKKPVKKRPGVFSFMSPLSPEIWGCVAFAYVGVSIVLFLVSRFSPHEWKIEGTLGGTTVANSFSVGNSLWFALGSLMQQGTDMTPRSLSGRIVGGAWWFFSLILISSYTANLAAFLTVERMVTPIKSVDELSQQTEIEYGALRGGSTVAFFKNSKITVYKRMWDFMEARPYVLTNTTKEGIERVRKSKGKYAFLIESTSNEYTNERLPCDTMRVGKNLDAKGYGIATAKGSGLQEEINLAVLNLKENGELQRLKNKWWYDNTECTESDERGGQGHKAGSKNELLLSNVAGIFFILVAGLMLALTAALADFCLGSRKEAARAKTTLSDAMRNKARLALSGGRDLDSVRFYGAGDSSAL